jgi:S-adenosylmethionine/arginine decarboxylase-like enzyme
MKKHHVIFEAKDCNWEALSNSLHISNCIRKIAELTNSWVLNEPIVVVRKMGVIGVTCALVTQSSHLIIHTFQETREASLDVYSYTPIDQNILKETFAKYFGVSISSVTSPEQQVLQKVVYQQSPCSCSHHAASASHQAQKEEEHECEEPGCSRKATKVWGGRKVCNDHYDHYREKDDEVKNMYPF